MKTIVTALALACALPAPAAVISGRFEGSATSGRVVWYGPEATITMFAPEPDAWMAFSYDTEGGWTSAAFDFGWFEGTATGPLGGGMLLTPEGVPLSGYVNATWQTPLGTWTRTMDFGPSLWENIPIRWDGYIADLVYRFTPDQMVLNPASVQALNVNVGEQSVPEPSSLALLLLGLISLPLVRRSC